MEKIIFSETNIFILSKLVYLTKKETGKKHKLATEASITELLLDACISRNEKIISYFQRFIENLSGSEISELLERGIQIPQHLVKPKKLFEEPVKLQYAFTPHAANS